MGLISNSPTTTFSSERWGRFAESLSAEGAERWALTMQVVKADVEALFSPRTPRFEAAPHPALHPGRSARVRQRATTSIPSR